MKLRIRCGLQSAVVEVESKAATLEELKKRVQFVLQLDEGNDIDLSLNAATSVSSDDQATLGDLDIVSGDLIHVLLPQGHPQRQEKLTVSKVASSTSHTTQQAVLPVNTDGACSSDSKIKVSHSQSVDSIRSDSAMSTTSEVCINGVIQGDPAATETPLVTDVDDTVMDAEVNRYLNEPILIRDSTANSLPQCLLAAHSNLKPLNNHEAVTVVLQLLMTELGYKLKTQASDADHNWRIQGGGGGLRLEYSYPQIEGVSFQLICVPMLSQIVVHGMVRLPLDVSFKVHVQLKTTDYIKSTNSSSDACQVYKGQQLSKLSNIFKDGVAYPLLQYALAERGLPVLSGLSTFVYELQLNILKYLDVTSLLRVSQTCRSLNEVTKEPTLWRRIFLRDFGRRTEMSLTQDWIQIYKNKHQERRCSSRRRPFLPPPFFGRHMPPPPTFNPYPPGFIIGGDYDLNPPNLTNPFRVPDPLLFHPNPPPQHWLSGGVEPMDAMIDQQLLPSVHPSVNLLSNPSNNIFALNQDLAGRGSRRSMQMPRFF